MKNTKLQFTTKWLTYTGVLTALVVATNFIPAVPVPFTTGRLYWVDSIVLIAAFLMDPLASFIVGGIGSLIYDIFWSPSMMLPSLIIHGLQGLIVSTFVHFVFPKILPKKRESLWAGLSAAIAAVEVILGYFVYRYIVNGLPVAIPKIPANVVQEIVGITIAMVVCYATTFKRQLDKSHLLPDFKKEVIGEKNEADT